LDFSDESQNVSEDLSTLFFQTNRVEGDLHDKVKLSSNEFTSGSDSSQNPFLDQTETPKKSLKMMMNAKNTKYDVFKNEMGNRMEMPAALLSPQQSKAKTEANPDLFKDFAIAAFSEFKVDKTPSMIHEVFNKFSDQKHLSNGHQMMKVINRRNV
jgi:hypothetical protein